MRIEDALRGVELVRRTGAGVSISGVEYDSRRVHPGSLFVAMQGASADGNRFIESAIKQGAAAVVSDSTLAIDHASQTFPQLALIEVEHGRQALAQIAANYFGHPEAQMALSGVTGTNGKTTTAFLLDSMLNRYGRKTVLVGTIEYHVAGTIMPSPHTTPESRDLMELFAEGVAAGASEVVMEVSSHALDQGRVFGLNWDVAIFTNLTRDHLDYHGTMEKYFAAKRILFDGSRGPAPRVAVVNLDDEYGVQIAEAARAAGSEVFAYGMDQGVFRAGNERISAAGMRFEMTTPLGAIEVTSRLTGKVNVYNLLGASAAAMARGLTPEQVASAIENLTPVPGRFQTVDAGQPFAVVVDYAHTDDALRNLIALARDFVKGTGGRVITLFGCGGDRDRTKRPLMGRAAGEGSDLVILTSDNPRSEDPVAILDDVLPALQQTGTPHTAEPDRAAAILMALAAARDGDIVLLAGKGHEKVQVLRDATVPFDDSEVARQTLTGLGYATTHAGASR